MFIVQCPQCKHTMKTDPKNVLKAVKQCVYCGKRFKVHSATNSAIRAGSPRI